MNNTTHECKAWRSITGQGCCFFCIKGRVDVNAHTTAQLETILNPPISAGYRRIQIDTTPVDSDGVMSYEIVDQEIQVTAEPVTNPGLPTADSCKEWYED